MFAVVGYGDEGADDEALKLYDVRKTRSYASSKDVDFLAATLEHAARQLGFAKWGQHYYLYKNTYGLHQYMPYISYAEFSKECAADFAQGRLRTLELQFVADLLKLREYRTKIYDAKQHFIESHLQKLYEHLPIHKDREASKEEDVHAELEQLAVDGEDATLVSAPAVEADWRTQLEAFSASNPSLCLDPDDVRIIVFYRDDQYWGDTAFKATMLVDQRTAYRVVALKSHSRREACERLIREMDLLR